MSYVGKVIFKLGAKRLSAAQKKALAKAIKASALKRARSSAYKSAMTTRNRVRLGVRVAKATKKLNVYKAKNLSNSKVFMSAQLKRTAAENKFKNPSAVKKLIGLHNAKSAAVAFKKADKEFVKASLRNQQSAMKVQAMQSKLAKLANKDKALIKRIEKLSNRSLIAQKEAQKYAKLSGTTVKASDLSAVKGAQEAYWRAFDATLIGLAGGTAALKVAANKKQAKKKKT